MFSFQQTVCCRASFADRYFCRFLLNCKKARILSCRWPKNVVRNACLAAKWVDKMPLSKLYYQVCVREFWEVCVGEPPFLERASLTYLQTAFRWRHKHPSFLLFIELNAEIGPGLLKRLPLLFFSSLTADFWVWVFSKTGAFSLRAIFWYFGLFSCLFCR